VGLRPSLREPPRDATCTARFAFGDSALRAEEARLGHASLQRELCDRV
jgi:hypothetical protein